MWNFSAYPLAYTIFWLLNLCFSWDLSLLVWFFFLFWLEVFHEYFFHRKLILDHIVFEYFMLQNAFLSSCTGISKSNVPRWKLAGLEDGEIEQDWCVVRRVQERQLWTIVSLQPSLCCSLCCSGAICSRLGSALSSPPVPFTFCALSVPVVSTRVCGQGLSLMGVLVLRAGRAWDSLSPWSSS